MTSELDYDYDHIDKDRRSRGWVFTLNNYTADEVNAVKQICCVYMIFGHEVGKKCGTPHLQGYVYFNTLKSFNSVRAYIPRARVAQANGTAKQNHRYCTKEATEIFEKGTMPKDQKDKGDAEKQRWAKILKAAEEGDTDWLKTNEPQVYLLHDKALDRAFKRAKPSPQTLDTLEHQWWYGPTGTGKSRRAREENPNAYIKDPKERWWDGYAGQDVVIIDDFDKYQKEQGGDMKRWLDHYPFQAPVKGSYIEIRPKKIIVTSNYHPSEIWDDAQTVEPILRRVHTEDFDPNHKTLFSPTFIKPN